MTDVERQRLCRIVIGRMTKENASEQQPHVDKPYFAAAPPILNGRMDSENKHLGSETIAKRLPNVWSDRMKVFICTSGGLGYSPFFPGGFGALPAIPMYWAIAYFLPHDPQLSAVVALALLISCVLTVWLGTWAEGYFGKKDSATFTTDEIAGLLLTLLIFHIPDRPGLTLLWAFPATRILDMIKPWPAKRLEHLPHGWGVLADDLMASVYTGLLLVLGRWLVPTWFGG